MPPLKKKKRTKTAKPQAEQLSVTLQPGTKIQFTIGTGRNKLPITIQAEEPDRTEQLDKAEQPVATKNVTKKPRPKNNWFGTTAGRLGTAFGAVGTKFSASFARLRKRSLSRYDLATWLFFGAVGIYIATRLIGLTHFPIYFFTDEALQTQFIADLVKNGYRGDEGMWFPPAFHNGDYFTLGMGVYLQWLPYIIFGKSAVLTRATSAIITLIAAVSVGVILRDGLKIKYWWTGTLFLSITPAWFLHSRTAWETAEFTAFYAGALCAYVLYRIKSPRYLYLAIFLFALGFYTYSPGQMLVPVTALILLISDWRYHWENRGTLLRASALLALLVVQYVRFRMIDPENAIAHLHTLGSYLFDETPLAQKILHYFSEYFLGIGAWYWYTPNDRDFQRHLMKDYGHIMLATLPFALLGLAYILQHLRESAHRTVLIAMLVAPTASALVYTGITRTMIFVIPASIMTAIGLNQILLWIENPKKRLVELSRGRGFTRQRILVAVSILLLGFICAYFAPMLPDRIAAVILAVILALQVSGLFEWLAKRINQSQAGLKIKRWNLSQTLIALMVFVILAGANIHLLTDALQNGPTWYKEYGMGGMQYGAFQLFDVIKQYQKDHPQTKFFVSSTWTNGADVVARFFMNDPLPFSMGSISGYIAQKIPFDKDTLFVITPEEYALAMSSSKLTDIHVEKTIPYPDGTPGFYFVRLRYVDNIDEIFAAEKALRTALREAVIKIDGQDVKVHFSYLQASDAEQAQALQLVFDNDPLSLAKTYEANPYVIEMAFPSPKVINGFSVVMGSTKVKITFKCYATADAEPTIYTFEGQGTLQKPNLSFDFPQATEVQVLRFEMTDELAPPGAPIHLWELTFR